ncbi:MAG TPA: glycosyltransferase [Candidatus Deferrimicrobiaceae bacterium]|jgi:glycosyltransferase involved in cell wall biosynthesis
MKKLLIFIVCYHAERFIEGVLERIPASVWETDKFETEILVIDDQSTDRTFQTVHAYARKHEKQRITLLYNPVNQGYGGNQKIGYHYAVEKGFDAVLLLHGDGQYPPEHLFEMVEPIMDGDADVVLGSRMIRKLDALKGGMPLYKWLGNQLLTAIQNCLLGCSLSEFHTGYRAYSVKALAQLPFELNSNYFDYDTDIIIQMLDTGRRIQEIPIPTFYGDEISRVNGIKYAAKITWTTLMSRIMRLGIFYHPKFDYHAGNSRYEGKFGYPSSHEFAIGHLEPGWTVLDVGCGPGIMARALAERDIRTVSVDVRIPDSARECSAIAIEADIESYDFADMETPVQAILLLDILEHLKSPESLVCRLRESFGDRRPRVIATTGNIAFFVSRMALSFGIFNYGPRGILDLDHTRLFTFGSFRRLFEMHGYDVLEVEGIPVPFPLALGNTRLARCFLALNRALIRLSKPFFSYQIAMVARPRPTLKQLLKDAEQKSETIMSEMG